MSSVVSLMALKPLLRESFQTAVAKGLVIGNFKVLDSNGGLVQDDLDEKVWPDHR